MELLAMVSVAMAAALASGEDISHFAPLYPA